MASAAITRPDMDIYADVEDVITYYPPLVNDRHHVKVQVEAGVVTVSGHVKTTISINYLRDNLTHIEGVKSVDMSQLFSDERLRIDIGQFIPMGVWANIEYGHVILSGHLPDGVSVSSVSAQISSLPGVRDIRTQFIA